MQRIGSSLFAALLLLASCKQPIGVRVPAVRPEAMQRFEAGEHYRRTGVEDRALEEYESAIAADENCVDAHRERQNLLRFRCRERDLLLDYRSRLEACPDNPVWHYLYGRMLLDPDEQRAEFKQAVRLAPDFYWGEYGLAYVAEVVGDVQEARRHYERAVALEPRRAIARLRLGDLERRARRPEVAEAQFRTVIEDRPDDPDGYLGLSVLLQQKRRGREAIEMCREAIRRRPADLAAQGMYRALLAPYGAQPDLYEALDLLEKAEADAPPTASLLLTRATCYQGLGETLPAIESFRRAVALGASPIVTSGALRLLHVREQDYAAALRDLEVTAPRALVFDPENTIRPLFEELYATTEVAVAHPADPASLLRLAEAYAAAGWLAEAAAEFERVLYVDPGNPRATAGLSSVTRHRRFVRQLRERVIDGYRAYAESGAETPFSSSLDRALSEIGALARETLQLDLSTPRRVREYTLIGSQLDPSIDSDDALVSYLRKWNQVLLLGRRAGAPTEALLLTRVSVLPRRRHTIEGETIVYDELIGGGESIPSLREYQGATLGGVAFEGMFVIQLDTVLSWQERARRAYQRFEKHAGDLLGEEAEPASSPAARRRIGHTFCLEEKLYLRSYEAQAARRRSPAGAGTADLDEDWRSFLSVVESHESGHLRDTRRFLPLLQHPFPVLGLLIGSGFSAARIEASLEENAELNALISSDDPWCCLGEIVSFLPFEDGGLPHSAGYARLLRGLVDEIAKRPERYPSIDPARNILQQLHRLSAEEIRTAARAVAGTRGL